MLLFKFTAYYITGSTAIFSDAAESVVHILATSMALYSIILSSKPADKSHPYGHGNIEYFSAGIEGVLIVIAAFFILYESAHDLIKGPELEQLSIGVIIISFAGITNLFLAYYLIRTGKKTNSLTLIADGKHVLTDSVTSIGVVIGIILVLITGIVELDPILAIIVAANILFTGYKLIRESIGGLMNETNQEILEKIGNKLLEIKRPHWIDMHELRFWQSGDKIYLDFHLTLPYYFNIKETHAEEDFITESLQNEFTTLQVKIHLDYCIPRLCPFCNKENCEVRESEKNKSVDFTIKKLTGPPLLNLPH